MLDKPLIVLNTQRTTVNSNSTRAQQQLRWVTIGPQQIWAEKRKGLLCPFPGGGRGRS